MPTLFVVTVLLNIPSEQAPIWVEPLYHSLWLYATIPLTSTTTVASFSSSHSLTTSLVSLYLLPICCFYSSTGFGIYCGPGRAWTCDPLIIWLAILGLSGEKRNRTLISITIEYLPWGVLPESDALTNWATGPYKKATILTKRLARNLEKVYCG